MQQVIDAFTERMPIFIGLTAKRLSTTNMPTYARANAEQVQQLVGLTYEIFLRGLKEDTSDTLAKYFEQNGSQRAEQGALIEDILRAIDIGIAVASEELEKVFVDQPAAMAWWYLRTHQILHEGSITLAKVFVIVRERSIRAQANQLREISTPIIPIHAGILVLPLIGSIDEQRAGQIMEALLEGISRYMASVVIIDITGVALVDTGVANYLLQAARSANLLGSNVILVGISPEVAQTIVQLGVDLASITTRANLEAGVTLALSMEGLAIRPIGDDKGLAGLPMSSDLTPKTQRNEYKPPRSPRY